MKTLTKLTAVVLIGCASATSYANPLQSDTTAELSNVISNAITTSINHSIEELKASTLKAVAHSLDNASEQEATVAKSESTQVKEESSL
ncbi:MULTISPECIES: hypothetical protein [Pseudoalteromonas]|uniref:Lipoprotein n=1 Tax=Pseudoalteromonas amylolytica TaxID=1859457 RepID=A0A1S1MQS6_9GAMM|nr:MULTISPECIES: hypothetical protein [Pseudoalteromonas]OHU87497.1 hypothetical protein BFC16_08535 [Pseudoalteromonas sp. JW3]OHU90940.1 hypothetical protein BET10_08650 [Pseudoalteromonas amylolytica]